MSEIHSVNGILDVIHSIASNRESGQLEIRSSGSHGILLFNEGRLVDARLESLTGFQAVNAAVSLRDVQFRFDPSISAPRSSSIAPHERVVLQRFFGIEAVAANEDGNDVEPEIDWDLKPHQVVPLAAVEAIEQDDLLDTPTVEVKRLRKPAFPLLARRPVVVYAPLLVLVLALGAVALIPKLNARRNSAEPVAQLVSNAPSTAQPETPRAQSDVSSITVAAPPRDKPVRRVADVQDLSGEWKVVNTVQKTTYKSFGNMQIGFRLRIQQTGNDFTAKGEKVSENGRDLPAASRTPIRVTGSIDGDQVVARFVEDGMTRPTNGRFVWKVQGRNAALSGTFISAAANSSGKSDATRQR
ncbi:MAG TPA: DUF4388 domain-containing protein [Pyrinomonadaceae bacterium]|nr:DUF4388 domain-containing protein [Pyrinomonadaceae bacterium]